MHMIGSGRRWIVLTTATPRIEPLADHSFRQIRDHSSVTSILSGIPARTVRA